MSYRNNKNTPVYSLEYTLPLFCQEQTKGQGEKRARDEGMNNDSDA